MNTSECRATAKGRVPIATGLRAFNGALRDEIAQIERDAAIIFAFEFWDSGQSELSIADVCGLIKKSHRINVAPPNFRTLYTRAKARQQARKEALANANR